MSKNVLIVGIAGRMGKLIYSRLSEESDFTCVSGYDLNQPDFDVDVPVTSKISSIIDKSDLVVDFSLPKATMSVLQACIEHRKGMVIGTTGYSNAQLTKLKIASKSIPVLLSYNMSMGIGIVRKLVRQMAGILPDIYDVEIVEKHHKLKQDAPSGTAYMIGQDVAKCRKQNFAKKARYGREGISPRKKGDITFHSLRGGSIIAEHGIYFIGDHDKIVIAHTAFDRMIFSEGVIHALKFIQDKKSGWYTMENILDGLDEL